LRALNNDNKHEAVTPFCLNLMPFLTSFGLRTHPFGLTPNTELFFPTDHAQTTLASLVFAIQRSDSLLKVVGHVGSGKTMLCRMLLERLEALPVNTAYLNAPSAIRPDHLPSLVLGEFGQEARKEFDAYMLYTFLLGEHAKGRRNVLIVDEAQALGPNGLEAIRLLSNLETSTHKLLQIVLFGQAELDQLLQRRDLRQVAQRVSFHFATQPLQPDEVAAYVRFRLERCADEEGCRVSFSPRALALLAKASQGLPRVVHILADKAFLALYADGGYVVETRHLRAALAEMPKAPSAWEPWRWFQAA
jgi:MSHA biogenesis protein MshM